MVWGAIGSALIGAVTSAYGASKQNKAAKAAAQTQMDFQERMSNTSYQRAMADMKKAGLNPMLAYQQGGAGTPGGSSYTPANIGAAAVQGAQAGYQGALGVSSAKTQRMDAKTKQKEARTHKAKMSTERVLAMSTIRHMQADTGLKDSQRLLAIMQESSESIRNRGYEVDNDIRRQQLTSARAIAKRDSLLMKMLTSKSGSAAFRWKFFMDQYNPINSALGLKNLGRGH